MARVFNKEKSNRSEILLVNQNRHISDTKITYSIHLTLSQTSPGFYGSAVQVF